MLNSDIYIPSSLFNDKNFFRLTSVQYRMLLCLHNGVSQDNLYQVVGFRDGKRLLNKTQYKDSGKQLDDNGLTNHKNRITRSEFLSRFTDKKKGMVEWRKECRNNPGQNPIRMRRETYDFIMNNKIDNTTFKLILLILWSYDQQKTTNKIFSLKFIVDRFGLEKKYNITKERRLIPRLDWIRDNLPNKFMNGYTIEKTNGERVESLHIQIRG